MDYQKEKGRINGLRTRREKSRDFALSMVPVLREARKHLPDRGGEGPSRRGLAGWLNDNGFKSVQGGNFAPETISRLYDIHIGMIEEAEEEYRIGFEAREYALNDPEVQDRDRIISELADIEESREVAIAEARRLSAELQGKIYRYEPAPPSLVSAHTIFREPTRADRIFERREKNVRDGVNELARLTREYEKKARAIRRRERELEEAAYAEAVAQAKTGRELALIESERQLEGRVKALRFRKDVLSLRERAITRMERNRTERTR